MIKNSHLVKKLRDKERRIDVPFAQKVQRYEEMHEIAELLNSDSKNRKKEKHLNHIVELSKKLRELSNAR